MPTRTDWTAPHWEAVAAEQLLLAPTLLKRNADRTIRIARSPHGGRRRLKHPETGAGLLTTGDVGQFGPHKVLRLWFGDAWHVVPSHADAMRMDVGRHGRDARRPDRWSRMTPTRGWSFVA